MDKLCKNCNISKNIEEFWFNKKINKYHHHCKKCKSQITKKYYNVSKEKKAEYDKKYRDKHKDILKEKKKEEYERNKEKYISRQLKYNQSFEGRIKHNIRTRIGNAIKRKSNSTFELLGCHIDFYITYLEFLFIDEMSWENYGIYWQIDHVKPIKEFDLSNIDEQKTAFNWKNTRPLEKTMNLSRKHNTKDDIEKHNLIIKHFLIATSSNCGNSLRAFNTTFI